MVAIAEVGEIWAQYRLTTLGYEAYRTTTGFASVDIRVVKPAIFSVQVKAASTASFRVATEKHPPRNDPSLFYVLVRVGMDHQVAGSFVVPATVMATQLTAIHRAWRARNPSGKAWGMTLKHPHSEPASGVSADWLDEFADRWDLLPA